MPLAPGYGETPIFDDEASAMLPQARELLGEPITKADVYDLERAVQEEVVVAGANRHCELNIGTAPELIAVELRGLLETIRYRWQHTGDWTARELGIAAHAESVRIHPFTDGNGRTTRLLADLVFFAAQDVDTPLRYSWDLDKHQYIALLRQYDRHRDARPLAVFIAVRALGE